jgi:hypothetical protein
MSKYLPLYVALGLLSVDAVIEVAFVGSMVGFLHDRAGKFFTIDAPNGSFDLHGKPKGLLVDQGHTSNGAAGTALVLVGLGGALAIWYDKRRERRVCICSSPSRRPGLTFSAFQTQATGHSGIFTFWVVMTILSWLLTFGALLYTFILTTQTDNQHINLTVAAANPEPLMYPLQNWTPENWFIAVLELPLAHDSDRSKIRNNLRLMRGWRWNLIPLFIIGLVVAALAVFELMGGHAQKFAGRFGGKRWKQGDSNEKFRNSTQSA